MLVKLVVGFVENASSGLAPTSLVLFLLSLLSLTLLREREGMSVCVHDTLAPSYYYMCSHTTTCVLILHMFPHAVLKSGIAKVPRGRENNSKHETVCQQLVKHVSS